jgi:hypothetical protein
MNNKALVGGIFCDLQKAFNCVNNEILIDKLEFYGIEGKFKTLLKSCGNITQSKHTIPTLSFDVGTSHSPTHNPYSFGRTPPILTLSVDQLLFLLLLPDDSYSRIHRS